MLTFFMSTLLGAFSYAQENQRPRVNPEERNAKRIEMMKKSLDLTDGQVEKIKELKTCLKTGNIPVYTIHAHSLKSAAANIGANELSMAAKDLETAGRRTDMNFIETHSAGFLASLELLLNNISGILPAQSAGNRVEEEDFKDADVLKSKLAVLKKALGVLDVDAINSTVNELLELRLPGEISAALRGISRNILISEFDEALALVENLLQEGK